MDIKTAAEIFGHDRLLIIGLIQFLINKKIISSQEDMEHFEGICLVTLETMKNTTKDAVALIQIEKTEIDLRHFFQSFRTK